MLVGPGVMPRFSFSDADRDALIAYVQYIRSQPAPGGTPIGGAGPVAEGFVAIVIGVPILLVVARFVGRRAEGPVEVGPSGGGSAATADGPEPPDGAEATEPGTPA
jgi:hypothetical protein